MTDLRLGGGENAPADAIEQLEALSANVDHYDPMFLNNRIEMFRILHGQQCPVRHSNNHDGYWFVSGYREAAEVQRRMEDFSNKQKVVPRREVPKLIPAGLDSPEHRPIKVALAKLFTPGATAEMKGALAEACGQLMDQCVEGGSFDVVQDLMFPLMARFTMGYMLGLDPAKAPEYARPIHNMSRRDCPPEAIKRELAALADEFRAIIGEKRYDPESMLARIAALEINGETFSVDDLVKVAFNLLIGGFGTTAAFTGSIFVFLARNPHLRQELIDTPAIIPGAIDELLRLFTPTQTFARRVDRDTQLCGFDMKEGDQLLMGYGAANFDPRIFENPEQVDFRRSPNQHMSFGTGPHRCLGENVARSILREVLTLMVERIPNYELVEDGVVAQSFSSSMFGYSNVKIRF